jgi:hypothetical protein
MLNDEQFKTKQTFPLFLKNGGRHKLLRSPAQGEERSKIS